MSDEQKNPPRLIDDPELGPALKAARDEAPLTPEQLAASGKAIEARIAKLPPGGGAGGLRIGPVATGLGVAVLAVVALRIGMTERPPRVPVLDPEMTASLRETPEPIATPDDTSIAIPLTTAPPVTPEPLAPTATPRSSSPGQVTGGSPTPTPPPTPAGGTLAEELRLLGEAIQLRKEGDHAQSLARLDDLAKRFPGSQVGPEAAITRGQVLVEAERYDEALPFLQKLLADPVHAGRRAELERTLGDVFRAKGDCPSARTRYRAALDAGASGEEASAARRGLGACQVE